MSSRRTRNLHGVALVIAALAMFVFILTRSDPVGQLGSPRAEDTSAEEGIISPNTPGSETAEPQVSAGSLGAVSAPILDRAAPPGSKEFVEQREEMVTATIERPRDGRTAVSDPAVLSAMRAVPRHVFVPEGLRRQAYRDSPLPIGHGQTISQPYIVALMTELLRLTPNSKVLEIGTGSGYQAAVLAHLTPHVYTIEIIKPLAERAKATLRAQGYTEIQTRHADGYHGWREQAALGGAAGELQEPAAPDPTVFDAVIVTCAAGHLPPPLWQQLKPGGRIVIPIGGPFESQRLVVVTKTPEGKRESKTITAVRFVPLTRADDHGHENRPKESDTP